MSDVVNQALLAKLFHGNKFFDEQEEVSEGSHSEVLRCVFGDSPRGRNRF